MATPVAAGAKPTADAAALTPQSLRLRPVQSERSSSPDLEAWGISTGYWDISGRWRQVPDKTVGIVLAAMGASATAPGGPNPLLTVDEGAPWPDLPPGHLELEGGGSFAVGAAGRHAGPNGEAGMPELEKLPLGYHRFHSLDGKQPLTIAVCPNRCPAPPRRAWGWSVQLYASRSASSWGIGDFGDLRRVLDWAGRQGAEFVLLNPLHAPAPGPIPEPSPYFPSSRCFLNPLYIRVEDVPGAATRLSVATLGKKAKVLNGRRLIDRQRVWALKSEALEELFAHFEQGRDEGFEEYLRAAGRALDGYTTFCALCEVHGSPWQEWPEELRSPQRPAVAAFAASAVGKARKRYHGWLQWLCDTQLAAATKDAGRGGTVRPCCGVGRRGRRRLALAGQFCPRGPSRGTSRRLQPHRTGLGLAPARPVEVARCGLRALHRDAARGARSRPEVCVWTT